jgi:hypothetical protein
MSSAVLIGIVAGVIGGIVGPLVLVLLLPRKKCPDCGEFLSRLRNCWNTPGVVRKCVKCGCGVNLKGEKV